VTSLVQGWKTYRLGDLAQYINGRAFAPEEWKTTGLPIIRIQNLTDADKPFNYCDQVVEPRYLVRNGDLLISWSATLGSFIWNRGTGVLNQHIFKALPDERLINNEFLHFLMLNTLDEVASHAHGIAMKHITKGKFEAIEVSIPSLLEQRRIVARLKECMERVCEVDNLSRELLSHSEHLPIAFRYDLWMECVRTNQLVTLDSVTLSAKNGLYKSREHHGSGTILLRGFNVTPSAMAMSRIERIALTEKELKDYAVVNGDILVSRVNSRALVGKSALVNDLQESAVHEAMLIRLRVDASKADPQFLVWLINSPQFLHDLRGRAKHAIGQSSINQQDLLSSQFPLPAITRQRELIERMRDFGALAANLAIEIDGQNRGAAGLRESILRKAFAAEL
ncbi:MAG: restriction endonuclease subunit S, partial [Burkholderiales bacterium]